MKVTLRDFQEQATEKLISYVRKALAEATEEATAVTFSAMTGAGKTVVAAALLERLLSGDGEAPAADDLSVLWLTDDPELNEQTRAKILAVSDIFTDNDLVTIQPSMNLQRLEPGRVYFLNIQKLGSQGQLVGEHGDKRDYTFWETITNTLAEGNARLLVIIDEAHRGMRRGVGRQEAESIIQRFLFGSPGEIPTPGVPVVLGISATPERFQALMARSPRTKRNYDVPVEAVRESGLVKDKVLLHHPESHQPEMTLLREAARRHIDMTERWAAYCSEQGETTTVRPVLLVQIEDGTKTKTSKTDLTGMLKVLDDELGPGAASGYRHCLEHGEALTFGDTKVPYIKPSEVEAAEDVRAVIFKTALNTGWDCPRAEAMMSFRPAKDATSIAQLVGRMVRAPLARKVASDEVLNEVSLFLPNYDRDALDKVLAALRSPDGSAVEVIDAKETVTLGRVGGSEDAFARLAKVPTYIIPSRPQSNQVVRLFRLAALLAEDGLSPSPVADAESALVNVMRSERDRLSAEKDPAWVALEEGAHQVVLGTLTWQTGSPTAKASQAGAPVKIDATDLDGLYREAARRIPEGLGERYFQRFDDGKTATRDANKADLYCIAVHPATQAAISESAQAKVKSWLDHHGPQISALPEDRHARYQEIWGTAPAPTQTTLALPDTITMTVKKLEAEQAEPERWKRHLYAQEDGTCPLPPILNTWESRAIEGFETAKDVVGWLRIVPRKDWALCVPYQQPAKGTVALYPDFLVVRKAAGGLVVDIVDPHTPSLADSVAKALGLAKYAREHGMAFGRILMVAYDEQNNQHTLDLKDPAVRKQVELLGSVEKLRDLLGLKP